MKKALGTSFNQDYADNLNLNNTFNGQMGKAGSGGNKKRKTVHVFEQTIKSAQSLNTSLTKIKANAPTNI